MEKRRILSIGNLNCHGIKDKIDYPEFLNLVSGTDIFGVCETWLKDKDEINLPNYEFYPLNRKINKGPTRGGIGVFIRSEIRKYVKIRYDLSNETSFWCKINKEYIGYHDDLYLGIIYIPPESSTREKNVKTDHYKNLLETTLKIKSNNILLVGDFNARTKNLADTLVEEKHEEDVPIGFYSNIKTKRNNQDGTVNKYGKKLTDHCIASRSYIINGRTLGDLQGKQTCHEKNGSSTVDYAVAKESLQKYIQLFQVLDPSTGSDHCPIKLELELGRKNISNTSKNNTTERPPPIRWNEKTEREFINRMNSQELEQLLISIDNLLDKEAENIDNIIRKIGEIYLGTTENKKTKKKIKNQNKHKPKQWYDHTCEELGRRLRTTAKLLAASPNNPHFRSNHCQTRKQYKKLLKNKKTEWKNHMIEKLEQAEKQDPKEYWKLVNELREKKQNGCYFEAERFTQFFEKLYSAPEEKNKKIEEYVENILNHVPFISKEPNFTLEELIKAIKALKCNKAAGPDRIPAEMIKSSSEPILKILLKTMNKIKSSFQYPEKWAIGITSLLFKDGDEEDPNNYRAITVTDVLSKLLAILMNDRLEKWSTKNNIIRKEQIGFEKKSRPSDHLFVFKTLIDSYNNEGKKLYACFVDFQKAFDSVWRVGLFYKLIKYGMDLGFIKLIKNMYDKTSQTLKINNEVTRTFRTYKGVKQGCILSPRLFNIFLNDLPEVFDSNTCEPVYLGEKQRINCLMYADDLIILSESEAGLQECLHKLHNYTETWDLRINIKKTKVMIIQRTGKRKQNNFYFGEHLLQNTENYKYLGTIITHTGSFKLNEVSLKQKGLRASYIISQNIGPYSKPSTSIRIFEKIIEPILLYNCEVTGAFFPNSWKYDKFIKMMWDIGAETNKVVLGFLKQLLGVNKKTTNIAIHAETGKYPISLKIFNHIIKYWLRLNTTQKTLLKMSKDLNSKSLGKEKTSWEKIVVYLLKVTNITEKPTTTENNNKIASKFKREIKLCYDKWWKNQAKTTGENKLDYYYKYKKTFAYETYLDNVPKYIRSYITRLRLSAHSFPIEIQRYTKKTNKITRENRKCTICNVGETGDEEHYLLACTNSEMSRTREDFFREIKTEIRTFESFTNKNIIDYCMTMNDSHIQMKMAMFAKNILTTYKEETDGSTEIIKPPVVTRAGRQTRKPVKLNL